MYMLLKLYNARLVRLVLFTIRIVEFSNSLLVNVMLVHAKDFTDDAVSGKTMSFFHVGMSIVLNSPPKHAYVNDDIGKFTIVMLAGYCMLVADND